MFKLVDKNENISTHYLKLLLSQGCFAVPILGLHLGSRPFCFADSLVYCCLHN